MKEIKFTKMDWEAPEVWLKRRRFVKIKENPSTGLYCYRHEWLDTSKEPNYCYEVVKPKGKRMDYPGSNDFGMYGMCISKNDRYLEEKIEWYLNNGFSVPFSQRNKK